LFCDGAFFTNTAKTVTAAFAFRTANLNGRTVGFGPRPFRGTGFDPNTTLAVHVVGFLCHPLHHSVPQINRIPSHVTFLLARNRRHSRPFDLHAGLTQQQLLSNIEQSRKELLPGS
jgi:hypothetical protein